MCMCVDVCLSVEVKAQRTAEAQHSLVAERKGARGLSSGEVKFFFSPLKTSCDDDVSETELSDFLRHCHNFVITCLTCMHSATHLNH